MDVFLANDFMLAVGVLCLLTEIILTLKKRKDD